MELQLSLELVLLLLPVGSMCALPDVLLPKPSIECCCFGRLLPIEPNLAPMAASVVIVLGELVVVVLVVLASLLTLVPLGLLTHSQRTIGSAAPCTLLRR